MANSVPQAAVSSTPVWIDGQGLNHDAYVAALRADEASQRHSNAADTGNVAYDPLIRLQRAASLADGLACDLQLSGSSGEPAGQLVDWDEATMPQRVAAAVAAAEAACVAAEASASADARTSYDALVVNAPQLMEAARAPAPSDQRPPRSPSSDDRGPLTRCSAVIRNGKLHALTSNKRLFRPQLFKAAHDSSIQ